MWNRLEPTDRSMPMYISIKACLDAGDFDLLYQKNFQRFTELKFELDAFPSATAATAWTAGCFLALFLNALLKPFSGSSGLRMHIVLTPLVGSLFVSLIPILENVSPTPHSLTYRWSRELLHM